MLENARVFLSGTGSESCRGARVLSAACHCHGHCHYHCYCVRQSASQSEHVVVVVGGGGGSSSITTLVLNTMVITVGRVVNGDADDVELQCSLHVIVHVLRSAYK